MNLELDSKQIETELNAAANKAITDAFDNYEVTRAIRESVARKVVAGGLAKALEAAVDKIDLESLSDALAKELTRSTTAAVVACVRASTVNSLYQLRHGGSYVNEESKKRYLAEIAAEIEK